MVLVAQDLCKGVDIDVMPGAHGIHMDSAFNGQPSEPRLPKSHLTRKTHVI